MTEQKLLPCPCCTGKPMEMQYDCDYWIQCEQCNLNTPVGGGVEEVAAIWNARAAQKVAAVGFEDWWSATPVLRENKRTLAEKAWQACTAWMSKAAQGLPEPVDLQHMALSEEGTLRWMSGRKVSDCELYAMPDFGRAPPLVRLDAVEPLVSGLRHEIAELEADKRSYKIGLDALRAEVERLKGLRPDLPPRPPEGDGLPRYGLRWNGPGNPLAVPMDDGYWTPWHLAETLRTQNAELEKALKYAVSQVPELGTVPGIHAALSAYEGREERPLPKQTL